MPDLCPTYAYTPGFGEVAAIHDRPRAGTEHVAGSAESALENEHWVESAGAASACRHERAARRRPVWPHAA